jgi:hypothetical protein
MLAPLGDRRARGAARVSLLVTPVSLLGAVTASALVSH